jgi:hypothetical protein
MRHLCFILTAEDHPMPPKAVDVHTENWPAWEGRVVLRRSSELDEGPQAA